MPASAKCTAGCPCFISFRHFYRFADSTRKRHTHSGCATWPQTHCVSWTCKICTASEKVLMSPMQSCTSTCIANAMELLSLVMLVEIAPLHAGHAYSSSVCTCCRITPKLYALLQFHAFYRTFVANYATHIANSNTQADHVCLGALTLL